VQLVANHYLLIQLPWLVMVELQELPLQLQLVAQVEHLLVMVAATVVMEVELQLLMELELQKLVVVEVLVATLAMVEKVQEILQAL
jgi:hypothetical protein